MYSGNMGLAHPFDAVLDAAARIENKHPDILFLLVGEGPRKEDLQAQVEQRGLSNVRFLPFQPRKTLAQSLSAADLHLVTMESALEGLVVPSKLYGALGVGRPALFLGPSGSEAARLIESHNCGTVLPSPSGLDLAEAIEEWHADPNRWAEASDRAHRAVSNGRTEAIDRFDRLFRTILEN